MDEDWIAQALESAQVPGVRFVDVRLVGPRRYQRLTVKNGASEALTQSVDFGLGVRVLREKGWGFAGTSQLSRASAREVGTRAARLALAAEASAKGPIPFAPELEAPRQGEYVSPVHEDPFQVSTEEKVRLLREAEAQLHVDPLVKMGKAQFTAWQEEKWYRSSEGASYHASITHVGGGIEATAVGEGEVQRRSYPTSFGGDFGQAGFEFLRAMELEAHAPECGTTAKSLLTAPTAPKGKTTLVLGSDQLALQIHESVGHATELDRVMAYEAGFAGTSFLKLTDRDHLRYGAEPMSIDADATCAGGLGTFGWDDEGVPGRRYPLVDQGVLCGFLSSRETAARLGLARSGGTSRADGWGRTPLIRMTNVNLRAGDRSTSELLRGISEGLYMETNRSWSIDDKRLNFQFGTEVGRRIVRGELGELVRNPIYAGMTPAFWNSLEATSDRTSWHLWGVPNCGKGQPSQIGRVGHGAPWGRFTDVQVGGA